MRANQALPAMLSAMSAMRWPDGNLAVAAAALRERGAVSVGGMLKSANVRAERELTVE